MGLLRQAEQGCLAQLQILSLVLPTCAVFAVSIILMLLAVVFAAAAGVA